MLVFFFMFCFSTIAQKSVSNQDLLKVKIQQWEKEKDHSTTDTLYLKMLIDLSYDLRYYNSDSLFSISTKTLKYSKQANFLYGQGRALLNLGAYYSDKGDYRAISYFQKSIVLFKEINNNLFLNEASAELAAEFANQGKIALALNQHLQNIDLAKKLNDPLWISINYSNIGIIYCDLNDFEEGIIYLKKAIEICRSTDDIDGLAIYQSSLAWAYSSIYDYTSALIEINKAIIHLEKYRIKDWLAYAYSIKGGVYVGLKKNKWALHWLNQAEALHVQLNDDRSSLILYEYLVDANLGINNISAAEKHANKAYNLAVKIKYPNGIKDAANGLAKIKKKQLNYKEALKYHEIMFQMADSLNHDDNRTSLMVQKSKMEFERLKKETVLEKHQDLEKQKYINYAIIAFGLVLLVIIYIYWRGTKTQKTLIKALNKKTIELEKNHSELHEINHTKDKLFSIIGHDLRSPIAALQDLLKLFKEGDIKKEELLDYIPKLKTDVDHIWFTLNNLLIWSYSQMKGANTTPKKIVLEYLIDENINFLSELALSKNIRIQNNLPGKTEAWADENQISVVFRNLLSNALKFTPKNGLIILDIEDRNSSWEIQIQDSGIGMNSLIQEKIFDKDTTHTTYGTDNEKGTGLGLSLCKEMIEKNQGSIWLKSAPDLGSTFYFTIPKES